jgi:hypothetical protein
LNSPPPLFSYIPLLPIPGVVSIDMIFPFTYMCTQYLYYIHPPSFLLHILPFSLVLTPSQDLFCPPDL